MKMRDLCSNKREIKYKKEERLKISHFLSPKESSYSWERRREKGRSEKKKKKRREEKRKRREEEEPKRYGILKFCMDFQEIVWISMELYG